MNRKTLSRRLKDWNASRYTQLSSIKPILVPAIDAAFHTTQDNDDTIARNLTDQGMSISSREVKKIRLENDWR